MSRCRCVAKYSKSKQMIKLLAVLLRAEGGKGTAEVSQNEDVLEIKG